MLLCINSISCISYIKIYSSILQFIFSFKISCFFSRTCTFMFHYIKLTSSFSSYIYFLKFLVVYLSFLFLIFFHCICLVLISCIFVVLSHFIFFKIVMVFYGPCVQDYIFRHKRAGDYCC